MRKTSWCGSVLFLSVLPVLLNCGGAGSVAGTNASPQKQSEADVSITPKSTPSVVEAENAMAAGDFERARDLLQNSLKGDPADARAHFDLGIVLEELGKVKEAEAAYRAALQHEPAFAHAATNLGLLLYNLDRFDEAKTWLNKALSITPDSVEANFNLAMVLANLKDAEGALKHYERAAVLAPKDPSIWLRLGWFRLSTGDASGAFQSAQKAKAYAPAEGIQLQAELGALFRQLGNNDEAIASFDLALAGEPPPRARAALLTERGLALKAAGHSPEALLAVQEAARVDPTYPLAFYVLGNSQASRKKWSQAIAAYQTYLRLDPGGANADKARAKLTKVRVLAKGSRGAANPR